MLLQTTGHQKEWAEEQAKWPTTAEMYDISLLSDQTFLNPSANYLAPNLNVLSSAQEVDIMKYLPPRSISMNSYE